DQAKYEDAYQDEVERSRHESDARSTCRAAAQPRRPGHSSLHPTRRWRTHNRKRPITTGTTPTRYPMATITNDTPSRIAMAATVRREVNGVDDRTGEWE